MNGYKEGCMYETGIAVAKAKKAYQKQPIAIQRGHQRIDYVARTITRCTVLY